MGIRIALKLGIKIGMGVKMNYRKLGEFRVARLDQRKGDRMISAEKDHRVALLEDVTRARFDCGKCLGGVKLQFAGIDQSSRCSEFNTGLGK